MSSAKISSSNGPSSHKKKQLDRFIPHSVTRSLFLSDHKPQHRNHYQELLGQQLLAPNITPKILTFGN